MRTNVNSKVSRNGGRIANSPEMRERQAMALAATAFAAMETAKKIEAIKDCIKVKAAKEVITQRVMLLHRELTPNEKIIINILWGENPQAAAEAAKIILTVF